MFPKIVFINKNLKINLSSLVIILKVVITSKLCKERARCKLMLVITELLTLL